MIIRVTVRNRKTSRQGRIGYGSRLNRPDHRIIGFILVDLELSTLLSILQRKRKSNLGTEICEDSKSFERIRL